MSESLIGRELGNGRFKIIGDKPLGKGGFATVYLGMQKQLNRKVAIKILAPHAAEDGDLVRRFIREARVVAMFEHPNIIKVIDSGSEDGIHYFVMNYLPTTLHRLLSRAENRQGLPLQRWLTIAKDIASALNYMHHHGTVKEFLHRDIKPGNIMFDESNNAILTDFGLVKGEQLSQLTLKDAVMGTPKYMSPEQVRGTSLDQRSDLYSFGIVLFEMLVGKPPFTGEPMTICHKQIAEPPPRPHELKSTVPDEVEKIVLQLIEKDPAERYQSAIALLSDLNEWDNLTRTSQTEVGTQKWDRHAPEAPTVIKSITLSADQERKEVQSQPTVVKSVSKLPDESIESTQKTESHLFGKKRRSIYGAAGVFSLLGIILIAYLFLPRDRRQTHLYLSTSPPGAAIFVNNVAQSQTPQTIPVQIGDTLIVRFTLEDFRSHEQPVFITSTDTQVVAVQLDSMKTVTSPERPAEKVNKQPAQNVVPQEPVRAATGQLVINSTPAGALVILDEPAQNKYTPCKLTKIPVGNIAVTLQLEGYESWSDNILIRKNETYTINADLIRQFGKVSIVVVGDRAFGGIRIDGEDYGSGPKEITLPVRPKPYKITVKSLGYKTQEGILDVTVKAGEIHRLIFTLKEISR